MNIPDDLIAAVIEGRAVLFLGAGASADAKNGTETIPMGPKLGQMLAGKFLKSDMTGETFPVIYDFSCSARDVRTVQEFVAGVLKPFQPAPHHLLVPKVPWYGILTTNYDLVVERAYEQVSDRLAELVPIKDDSDPIEGNIGGGKLAYIKLHGCLTRASIVDPPLVASTEQLIAFKKGRAGQFDTFLEWAKTKTIIFCGYKFADPNLRTLFQGIVADGDNRPTHYLVSRTVPQEAVRYWANRRVEVLQGTFQAFIEAMHDAIPAGASRLSGLLAARKASTFTKFIDKPGSVESDGLLSYIGSQIEHLSNELVVQPADSRKFYRGTNQGWSPIKENLDVKRGVSQDILRDEIVARRSYEGPRLVVITGHAGAGKTILLRRVAWEAFFKHERLVFFVSREHVLNIDRVAEICDLTTLEVFFFVDNVEEHRRNVERIMSDNRFSKSKIRLICASNTSFWNTVCEPLHSLTDEIYELPYLSLPEIDDLIQKLTTHESLGYMKGRPIEFQRNEMKNVYGRQLLVALLEATNGEDLVNIVAKEYRDIEPVEARKMYVDICSLHRFGPPVRAGVMSRLHDIGFEEFAEKFFKPLSQIVRLRLDGKSGDYVYEARHSYIAQVVYDVVFKSDDDRFDNIVALISHLNPIFSYDEEILFQLIKADNVQNAISNKEKARQIYDVAFDVLGDRFVVHHQRAIYEMASAKYMRDLDVAERYVERAIDMEPHNRTALHTRAEIILRRSRLASEPMEREAYRRQAISVAAELTVGAKTSHAFHTVLKAKVDRVRDIVASVTNGDDVPFVQLNDAIAEAEGSFRTALQRFPNDAILVSEEGNLQQALSEAGRAEDAFRRAFDINPRSSLLARRLAFVRRSRGDVDGALEVLRRAIDQNGGDGFLHFELAKALMSKAPDAETSNMDEILHHLRRAYNNSSKDHQIKFWYARQIAVSGNQADSDRLFKELAALRVPYADKMEVRGTVLSSSGEPKLFTGSVVFSGETYALLIDDELQVKLFASGAELKGIHVEHKTRLAYNVAFNLRGPQAINIKTAQ